MSYLRPELSGAVDPLPQATEWLETNYSSGDNVDVSIVHAAETGKTHYLTFVHVGTDNSSSSGGVTFTIKDGGGSPIMEFWPMTYHNGGVHNFTFPIKFTEGNAITVATTMAGTDDKVVVTFGGYTR